MPKLKLSGQMSRLSPVTEKMVIALKNAVPGIPWPVEVTGTAPLWSKMESGKTSQNNLIWVSPEQFHFAQSG
ncbi:MAG UNVERIFIED_CONTAM: hypothetical protein LVR29_31005 [Microcystis novacekii LVE1205-3]|jgi:hypothetical protein